MISNGNIVPTLNVQRCHREHSKFPENLLRGSFFVFQCGIVCSGAYFRGYFQIFLHIISVFNWVLGTYCHIVINKNKNKKSFPLFGNFRKSGNFRKCGISECEYGEKVNIIHLLFHDDTFGCKCSNLDNGFLQMSRRSSFKCGTEQ